MTLSRLVGAIGAALLLAYAPLRAAEQSSYVTPESGPMSMSTFAHDHLNPALRALAACSNGSSAPANGPSSAPLAFQVWCDTTSNPAIVKQYDGASWVALGAIDTSAHTWTPYRQGSPIVAVATSGSASDLSTGTLPAARLPNPSASALGGVQSKTCSSSNWLSQISTSGVPGCSQPSFSDLASSLACSQLPAMTGDVTSSAGSCARTLANIPNNVPAAGAILYSNSAAPSTPASGKTAVYVDSTSKNIAAKNDAGTVNHGVQTKAAVTSQWLRSIADDGTTGQSQPAFSDISGAFACSQKPAETGGDVTSSSGSCVLSIGASKVVSAMLNADVFSTAHSWSGTQTFAAPIFTGATDAQGTLKISGFVTSTSISANQNDYTATDGSNTCSAKAVLRLSATGGSRNVTGLSCGQADGDIKIVHNVGSQNIVLTNQDTLSSAANRFLLGGDATLQADYSITLKYDAVTSRWRAITTASAGGGGGVSSVAIVAGTGLSATGTCSITTSGTCTLSTTMPEPGGRLTLQSGVPVMDSDQIGKQTLYYAPMKSGIVPVRVSGAWTNQSISSSTDQVGLSLSLAGSSNWAAGTIHDVFAIVDGGTVKIGTRLWDSGMYPTETQITNATAITTGTGATAWLRSTAAFDGTLVQANAAAARLTPSNTGLANYLGQDWGSGNAKSVSKFVITAASDTYVRNDVSPTALQLLLEGSNDGSNWYRLGFYYISNNVVGASYTIPVNVSNRDAYRYHRVGITGDASNSINVAELQFYQANAPANGRRLIKYDGLWVNDAAITLRTGASTTVSVAQYEGTYLGTIKIDDATAGQITAHTTFGSNRVYNVWNAYNQRRIVLRAGVLTPGISSYTLTSQLWQLVQTGFSLQVLQGLAGQAVPTMLSRGFYINAASGRKIYEAGIAVDNTTSFSGSQISAVIDNTGPQIGFFMSGYLDLEPFAGSKTLNAIERTDAGAGSISPFVEQRSTVLRADWSG